MRVRGVRTSGVSYPPGSDGNLVLCFTAATDLRHDVVHG
jgi:hypothetical protein